MCDTNINQDGDQNDGQNGEKSIFSAILAAMLICVSVTKFDCSFIEFLDPENLSFDVENIIV